MHARSSFLTPMKTLNMAFLYLFDSSDEEVAGSQEDAGSNSQSSVLEFRVPLRTFRSVKSSSSSSSSSSTTVKSSSSSSPSSSTTVMQDAQDEEEDEAEVVGSQGDVGSNNSQSSFVECNAECVARDANFLRNGLALSVHEWQGEIQTTYLVSSIAQDPNFEQSEQEAAAAKQTHHESLLHRRQMDWDQHGTSSISIVPPGLPHDLTRFASEVNSSWSQDVTQVCGTQQADSNVLGTQESQNDANNEDDTMTLLTQRDIMNEEDEVMDTFTYLECHSCLQSSPDCTCTAYAAAQEWPKPNDMRFVNVLFCTFCIAHNIRFVNHTNLMFCLPYNMWFANHTNLMYCEPYNMWFRNILFCTFCIPHKLHVS